MSSPCVVCNASPLIALTRIGRLDLLHAVFGTLLVPEAVVWETAPMHLPAWINPTRIQAPLDPRLQSTWIGPGEREAIALAMELGASRLLLDDLPARKLAAMFGLPIIGTIGTLTAAKRQGHTFEVRGILDRLLATGFRMAPKLYENTLKDVGELP